RSIISRSGLPSASRPLDRGRKIGVRDVFRSSGCGWVELVPRNASLTPIFRDLMSCVGLRFDVEAADGDRWSDALLDAGALSVDAVDPCAGTPEETPVFAEPAGASPQWWPISRPTAPFDAQPDS